MPAISLQDRFEGCLLGQAVGDALGSPFEGMTADWIDGQERLPRWVEAPDRDDLRYTDDTQMMIGVAEELAERGTIDEESLAARFAANYEPWRGYGMGARRVLEAIASGDDWRTLSRTQFPGGSFGNGAAMRAAPIGLMFPADLDRVSEEARRSALPTHVHPIGIDGARLIALAVALVLRMEAGAFERTAFFRELYQRAETEEMRSSLAYATQLTTGDSIAALGNGIEAHRSVVTATALFAASADDYAPVIRGAIALGGDTDTIAAMAGAISGAYLGIGGIPNGPLTCLEEGAKGRSYLQEVARRLCEAQ